MTCYKVCKQSAFKDTTRGASGVNAPSAESLGAPKSPSNVASTFFNTVHLLPKDLSSNMGEPNFFFAPGAI